MELLRYLQDSLWYFLPVLVVNTSWEKLKEVTPNAKINSKILKGFISYFFMFSIPNSKNTGK
ncbi:hypothetical protein GCM10010976_24250 [Bizionia arctica]|uniref:Uncharacterized protein n=1 Tax=Bizionia arctica TaxID=1495645 RepID=A0A917GN14_9FLAO|nr:hypothetical protein GCM10010976_24250 [Bizionia arctica]